MKWTVRVFNVFTLSQIVISVRTVLKLIHSKHSCRICSFVFKNRTVQVGNDENVTELAQLKKIYTNYSVRETTIITHHGDSCSSQCSNLRCVELKAKSVTAADFYGRFHPEEYFCSYEVGCCSFLKLTPEAVVF